MRKRREGRQESKAGRTGRRDGMVHGQRPYPMDSDHLLRTLFLPPLPWADIVAPLKTLAPLLREGERISSIAS